MYRNQRERVGPLGFDTAQTAGPTQPALLTQNLPDSVLVERVRNYGSLATEWRENVAVG